ncbi:MAG TPA: hypothetical protein VK988_10235 [Acidimicrobiales bacterium]|nr:hypothetical protein [Acidimicrobiales bacterium]
MRSVRLLVAILLVTLWAGITFMLWLTSALMSVDEEWGGWGDVLLDPYIMGPYLAVTMACIGGAVLLCRGQLGSRYPNHGEE